MSKVDIEKEYRNGGGDDSFVNAADGNVETAEKEAVASALSVRGLTARVITYTGTYVKVKWFKDNKPYQVFKMRNYDEEVFLDFINAIADYDGLPADEPAE